MFALVVASGGQSSSGCLGALSCEDPGGSPCLLFFARSVSLTKLDCFSYDLGSVPPVVADHGQLSFPNPSSQSP